MLEKRAHGHEHLACVREADLLVEDVRNSCRDGAKGIRGEIVCVNRPGKVFDLMHSLQAQLQSWNLVACSLEMGHTVVRDRSKTNEKAHSQPRRLTTIVDELDMHHLVQQRRAVHGEGVGNTIDAVVDGDGHGGVEWFA